MQRRRLALKNVHLNELDFPFPDVLIAQRPVEPRDSCRLMYLGAGGELSHRVFSDLPEILRSGDVLVFNDSKVLPARLQAQKPTGGLVEVLFVRLASGNATGRSTSDSAQTEGKAPGGESWEILARPSHRLRPGGKLILPGGEQLVLRSLLGEGRWLVEGSPGCSLLEAMQTHGQLPLPPYIKTSLNEPLNYQTVYASEPGSAAAPTAGLHFTHDLLRRLEKIGVEAAHVTLHVGLDTFQPIREDIVEDHRIHRETYIVRDHALKAIKTAHKSGRRLVAVGTTATRVLETLARDGVLDGPPTGRPVVGSTDIFITPGHSFRAVDALLTNFHLPRSSVLALTMAFCGIERLRLAYQEAVAQNYRLFSFGDAMLIEKLCADMQASGDACEHT